MYFFIDFAKSQIQIVNITDDTDLQPPERVTTLKVTLNKVEEVMMVKFIATGEDLDSGTGTLPISKFLNFFKIVSIFFITSKKL